MKWKSYATALKSAGTGLGVTLYLNVISRCQRHLQLCFPNALRSNGLWWDCVNYWIYLVVHLHMRDVFRVEIKQKYWKDFVNTWDLGCHLVAVQRNARAACRSWWVYCVYFTVSWFRCKYFFLSCTMNLSCTICLVVNYMTVAVNLLTAHSRSQGLGWLQQATNRKSHAAWIPKCLKECSCCCLKLHDVRGRRTQPYCWQVTHCWYLAIFC